MLGLVVVLIAMAGLYIYLLIPGGRLWRKHLDGIKASFAALPSWEDPQVFDVHHLAGVPALLQKHIRNGGFEGRPVMDNMTIHYGDVDFRMEPGKKPIKIDYRQVSFVRRPDRHVFLTGAVAGLPFQAKDTIIDGVGSMTGVLAKHVQLFHVVGDEMNQGQLITALADAVFLPSLFLQPYVQWTEIDQHHLEACILWNGVSGKGTFTLDENGDIIRFDTHDRRMDLNGKGSMAVPWHIVYSDYAQRDGYRLPGAVAVAWDLPDGQDEYFVCHSISVAYSVEESAI